MNNDNHVLGTELTISAEGKSTNTLAVMLMCDISRVLGGTYTIKMWGRRVSVNYKDGVWSLKTSLTKKNTEKNVTVINEVGDRQSYDDFAKITDTLYNQYETDMGRTYYGLERGVTTIMSSYGALSLITKLSSTESHFRLRQNEHADISLDEMLTVISFLYLLETIIKDINNRIYKLTVHNIENDHECRDKYKKYNEVRELLILTSI